jgi:Bacterioferritin (cytochrome b1)
VVHPGHRKQSPNIFEDILADEERFVDYLETQLDLMVNLGEQLCLSQLVERPPSSAT